jgi:hypothetical protein
MHIPEGRAHKEDDGSHTSVCRYCERPIVSWDKARWFLADGFNVTHLAETVGGRFLFVVDTLEETMLARYPVRNAQLLRSGRPPKEVNVQLGDIVLNQQAIQAVWEVEAQKTATTDAGEAAVSEA